jgi:hypothetical protein
VRTLATFGAWRPAGAILGPCRRPALRPAATDDRPAPSPPQPPARA